MSRAPSDRSGSLQGGAPKPDAILAGLGPRSAVPRMSPGFDWRSAAIDDQHGFVLSRVDGRTSLGQIVLLVPFPEAVTARILAGLHAAGAIEIDGLPRPASPPPPVSPPKQPPTAAAPPPVRAPEIDLAREPLHAHPHSPRRIEAPPSSKQGMPVVGGAAKGSAVDDEAPVDLSQEQRERIDALLALVEGDPRRLLGVSPEADARELRRAYFRLSKEFHPDRFYGKRIGPYRRRLQLVFTGLTRAFEELSGKRPAG